MKYLKALIIIIGVGLTANIVWGAISDVTKTDINFKVNVTKQFSTTDKQFYEEAGNKIAITGWQNIWSETLSGTPATDESSGLVTCTTTMELTEDATVTGNRSWTTQYPAGTTIRHWVPPFYGDGYLIKIYKDDGSGDVGDQIAPGDASDWFFDYGEGRWTAQDAIAYTEPLHVNGCYYTGDLLSDKTFGGSGGSSAWEAYTSLPTWMTPTTTNAGIYLTGSATTTANLYVTGTATMGNSTSTGSLYITDDLKVNSEFDIPADTLAEGDINFSTSCAAGNHLYVSGNDLACEADDDTTYTAGDYITLTATDFDVDVEAVTDTKCAYWEDPVATDDFKSIYYFEKAATITRLWCESDQTVTMTIQEDDGTPADIETTDLVCDSTPANQTTSFEDSAIAAGSRIDFAVASVASTPTWASFCFSYTYND